MPVNKDSEEYKSSRCVHILTKGVRKDLQCENKKCLNSRLVAKVKPEKVEVKPEKVKVKPEKVKPKSKSKAVQVLE